MSLSLEPLESRTCASAVDAGGGFVRFDSGAVVSAFGPTWAGAVNVVEDAAGGRVYVGPDQGGGPNLATFDLSGNRVVPDVYVGRHPEGREGLVPVLVGGITGTAPVPQVTLGTGRLTYFLDFSQAGEKSPGFVRAVAEGVAERLAPLDVTVTTVFPAGLRPGTYVTGAVLPTSSVSWFSPQAAGLTTDSLDAHGNLLQPLDVYAGCGPGANPELVATELAHEFGHAVGLPHRDAPDALMRPTLNRDGFLDGDEADAANADIGKFLGRVDSTR